MAQFKFLGDPNDDYSGPDVIEWEGYVFSRDGWTEVPDDQCAKLRGNSHFEERGAEDETVPLAPGLDGLDIPAPKRRGRPPKAQG